MKPVVVDGVEGRHKVNVEEVEVLVVELGVLNGVNKGAELSMAILVLSKAFLCGREDMVALCKEGGGVGDVTCPNLAQGVRHGDRTVVAKVSGVSLLVDKRSNALHPGWGSVACEPEVLEQLVVQ